MGGSKNEINHFYIYRGWYILKCQPLILRNFPFYRKTSDRYQNTENKQYIQIVIK
jgi:hypothetical protein